MKQPKIHWDDFFFGAFCLFCCWLIFIGIQSCDKILDEKAFNDQQEKLQKQNAINDFCKLFAKPYEDKVKEECKKHTSIGVNFAGGQDTSYLFNSQTPFGTMRASPNCSWMENGNYHIRQTDAYAVCVRMMEDLK